MIKPRWMAVYTRPRSEKKVNGRLEEKGYTTYLPLKKTERQWSDRVKIVELPLIPSYVFVQCTNRQRPDIVCINGVVNFVFERGQPAIIRDEEMERMWTFLEKHDTDELEVINLEPGEKVKVDGGPMSGNKGSVVHADSKKVTILIESLNMQIRAEIATKDVEKIEKH